MELTFATFAATFLPRLAAGLTSNLLGTSARSLRKRLSTPERAKALERCSGAAIAALLAATEPGNDEPGDDQHANLLGDIFERFFNGEELGPDVAKEVAVLLRGEQLNRQSLAELFEEAGFEAKTLPGLDLGEGLAAFESAFVLTAQQEGALQGEIQLHETAKQTVLQQKILDRLGEMAAGPLLKAGSIDAQNVVNGIQIIVQIGGGASGDADNQAASDRRRYLQGLRSFCRSLPVAALGGDEQLTEEVTLDQVFIDLDSTTYVEMAEEEMEARDIRPPRGSDGPKPARPLSLAETVRDHPKLVVLGDPGSGKSSFVKELLARLASAQLGEGESPSGIPGDLLPALLELRDLAPRLAALDLKDKSANRRRDLRAAAVRDLLADDVARFEAPGFSEALREAFTTGDCFLVLDGLDEVPPDLRKEVRDSVAAAITKYKLRHVVLTCRKLSYEKDARLNDFHDTTIADLSRAKIHSFVAAWYSAQRKLNRIKATEQEAKTKDLQTVALSDDLRDLSKNPMLLTTMALIHQKEVGLPRERVRLYHLAVEVLALRWQKHKTGRAAPSDALASILQNNLRLWQILTRLGYEAHKAQHQARARDPKAPGSLLRGEALTLLERPEYLGTTDLANEFLDYTDQRAGLFVGQGSHPGRPPSYRFPHQTLQEYLAGRYMATQEDRLEIFYQHAGEGDFWRVAACLGAEDLFHVRQLPSLLLGLAYRLCPAGTRSRTKQAHRAELWSGHMATIAGVEAIENHDVPDGGKNYLRRLRKRLRSTTRGSLPARERIQAGQLLGQLGEPDDSLTSVAKLELCWVPRGEFFVSGAAKSEEEKGDLVDLDYGYWIGRFPVTQGQFGEFVAAGGYNTGSYWPEAKAAEIWKDGKVKSRFDSESRDKPVSFRDPFGFPNHPVVGVTWYEMLAFCRWLTEKAAGWIPKGSSFCLPSEGEWEKAARGGAELPTQKTICPLEALSAGRAGDPRNNELSRRRYPWGQDEGSDRGNFGGLASETSRPGIFLLGSSPLGCEEMAGNVWEWTRSLGDKGRRGEQGTEDEMRTELQAGKDDWRYLCGGAYYMDSSSVGCSARFRFNPGHRYDLIGFRVVLLPFTLDSGNSEL